ncbi:tRNA 2-selenouridine synthase [Thermovibrio ammonificans HB-1]|uniref:tRNA 2-selenouridine synthase n=1 Tax=Thermovibrio ammonificans (strain DSM 15698 / JCM 12110 / HB-1) TaxID=648996 RepID=E8T2C5_THEA1|nr:tRNA 2-selenouridine(34) synthase MnmH [Thermovibrio ammonificans]ADU97020.1 tRNA 2-selenouridine synthase [Thermovibrio ammonificans HB-1]
MELVKEITVEEALKRKVALVDVRTREEFEQFRIPGAYNVPLFTKEEKEKVSKVYYEKGEKAARLYALELVGPKLHRIVRSIKEIKEKEGATAVYCWRGGLRSLAVATICNLTGVFVFRLQGGYRAFRQYILRRIEEISKELNLVVVYGPTGVGKTRMLRELQAEGLPIIDLEGLAGHRGSVFGGIGLKQPTQKMFDALLWQELERLKNAPFVVVEGESKKIGNLHLPDPFWKAMERGHKLLITLPLQERVKISMEDYMVNRFQPEVYLKALKRIEKILGNEKYREIAKLIQERNYPEAVKELMVNYYDKLYSRSIPETDSVIEASNYEEAKERLKNYLLSLGKTQR